MLMLLVRNQFKCNSSVLILVNKLFEVSIKCFFTKECFSNFEKVSSGYFSQK